MRIDARFTKLAAAAVMAMCALLAPHGASAQPGAGTPADLARQIERRFTVLPITGGIVLTPRAGAATFKSIEIESGTIAVDGTPVSGAELRQRLGADADSVLQLSYLSAADQRAIADGTAIVPAPAPEEPPPPRREGRQDFQFRPRGRGGDVLHIGRETVVKVGQVVDGSAVSIGSSVRVYGEVRGDVVSVGGTVELGPTAVVSDNVVIVGGSLVRDPGARIGGDVREIAWDSTRFSNLWRRSLTGAPAASGFSFGAPLALFAVILRTFVLCVLALLVILVAGNFVERTGERAVAEPLKAGAVGFLAAVLFLPVLIITVVVLVVTIIGIPLLILIPFALLALLLVSMVGFTAISLRVGRFLGTRLSWTENPYLFTALGVVALLTPAIGLRLLGLGVGGFVTIPLALLIWCAECVVWMIGFGAVALAWFARTPAAPTTSSA